MSTKYFIFLSAPLIPGIIFIFPVQSSSQEMEPRNYSSIPVGLNVVVLNYAHSTGAIVTDAAAPIQDLELTSNSVALGYLRSFGISENSVRYRLEFPLDRSDFVFSNKPQ